MHKSVN